MRPSALLLALVPAAAFAHARLDFPTPRSLNSGVKVGPCGSDPKTAPTVFEPGQTINVKWVETVDHPGHYRVAFAPANDTGFDQNVLKDNISNPAGLVNGNVDVTLPSTPCEGCTLQLIQVMTNTTPPSNYYSCADIALRAPDAGTPAEDAGTPVADAGEDAGGAVEDAGGTDAGAGAPDSGAQVTDPMDAGEQALSPITAEVGCSAGAGTGSGFGGLALLAAGFALVLRRFKPSSP